MSELLRTKLFGYEDTAGNEEKVYKNWNKIGFLNGLEEKDARAVSMMYELAARRMVHCAEPEHYSEQYQTLIFPAIRRIYGACRGLRSAGQECSMREITYAKINENHEIQEKLIKMIDVDTIMLKLYFYVNNFMVHAPKNMTNIDLEAELLVMFETNEVVGMYESVKN